MPFSLSVQKPCSNQTPGSVLKLFTLPCPLLATLLPWLGNIPLGRLINGLMLLVVTLLLFPLSNY